MSRGGAGREAPRFLDLEDVEIEHILGVTHGPLVKIRAHLSGRTIGLGEVDPAAAREIAGHLLEAAARAEYEADLHRAAVAAGFEESVIAGIVHLVRSGEVERHEGGDGG